MARKLRISIPNFTYHILDRGNNRQEIFLEDSDYQYFLKLINRYKKELRFKLYHLCLMPNHIHLMLEPKEENVLQKLMMCLTLAYSVYFNKKYNAYGHLWQGRYKSCIIEKGEYFVWCGVYIELNPVRAGIVKKPEDYKWSSYSYYSYGKGEPLIENVIDLDPYYFSNLGNTEEECQKRYKEYIEGVMEEKFLKKFRQNIDIGVLGSDEFIEKIKDKFNIKLYMKRGRPKKHINKG